MKARTRPFWIVLDTSRRDFVPVPVRIRLREPNPRYLEPGERAIRVDALEVDAEGLDGNLALTLEGELEVDW